jgi:hypothetical protein
MLQDVSQKRGLPSGLEFESLVVAEGYLAFEIKSADKTASSDARHLRNLDDFLDKPLLHAFVLSSDMETIPLVQDITAVHAGYFLG